MTRRREEFENGMSEEMRFHIEQYTAELVRQGVPEAEAARRARIEFGPVVSAQEDCRQASGWNLTDGLARDFRYAFRSLRKAPGFTITAVLTLAVCLSANLAIFAVVDSVLLRPLPFRDAGRLVTMYNTYPKAGVLRDGSSVSNYVERRTGMQAFSSLSIYRNSGAAVGEPGSTEYVPLMEVSPEFFATLGVTLSQGRTFRAEEQQYKTGQVVILSDEFWRNAMHADPAVLGKKIRTDGGAKEVVGVLPPNFRFLSSEARIFMPFFYDPRTATPSDRHNGGNAKHIIARLKPGVTLEAAQTEIDLQNVNIERLNPQARMMTAAGFRTAVTGLQNDYVEAVRPALLLLQAGVFALLLIGIVNLSNLLLIRASARSKELAVRQALGAGKRHILREALVETTLLAVTGALLGLALGAAGVSALERFASAYLPLGASIAFDLRIAAAGLFAAITIAIGLALPISWLGMRSDPQQAMQSEGRSSSGSQSAQRLRHGFAVAQIAIAFVLLAGAGLLAMSLERVMAVDPGFRPDHVLTGHINISYRAHPSHELRAAFINRLFKEIAQQPGVVAVGGSDNVPFSGDNGKSSSSVKGDVRKAGEAPRGHYSYFVDGDYFTALSYHLREGRFLTAADSIRNGERNCVVDEDFASFHWPGQSALGRLVFIGSGQHPDAEGFRVVGVVNRVKQAGLAEGETLGAVYYPGALQPQSDLFFVIRTTLAPEALNLQALVRSVDPDLPVTNIRSMDARISQSLTARKSPAMLATLFSGLALLLTAIGTYGVISYAVAQRKREIGLRMALGARPDQIRSHFLALSLRLLIPGVIAGAIGALWTGRAMQTLLFDVPAWSWIALGGAAAVLMFTALAACLLPSWRAARISPVEVLSGN